MAKELPSIASTQFPLTKEILPGYDPDKFRYFLTTPADSPRHLARGAKIVANSTHRLGEQMLVMAIDKVTDPKSPQVTA